MTTDRCRDCAKDDEDVSNTSSAHVRENKSFKRSMFLTSTLHHEIIPATIGSQKIHAITIFSALSEYLILVNDLCREKYTEMCCQNVDWRTQKPGCDDVNHWFAKEKGKVSTGNLT
jgi:hypothetical protein